MRPKHPYIVFLLFGILWSISFNASAVVVRGQEVTASEAAILPPVCKLIIIEQPNAHIDRIAQQKNAALFDRPEYRMAKNAYHIHHWCRAVISRHRYFNATNPQKKRNFKAAFYDDMDYVIRNMRPDWPYMPLMHAEKGEMYLHEKDYGSAVSEAMAAIRQNPAFVRGHVLLINVHNAMGQKSQALEAATDGLRHNPQSSALKKMYDELGGPKPYPEPYAKAANPAPKPDSDFAEPLPPPASDDFKASDAEDAVPQPLRAPGEADTVPAPADTAAPGSAPRPNKYCRFCP